LQILIQNTIAQLAEWMYQLALQYRYPGIFLISFFGALSIFFPIPYTVVIFWLGGNEAFNPFLIAVVAGVGSAIGELLGYTLGFYGRKVLSEERSRKMEFMVKVFDRFGPIAIFLFALTPLPDDLIFIPLGIMHYNFLRAFVPAWIGKTCMNFIVAYGGHLANEFIKSIFGEGSDLITFLLGGFFGILLFVITMFIMFKIDWEKIFLKYVKEDGEKTG
jgi:membrane protein YqaA with SNARE-associated domain